MRSREYVHHDLREYEKRRKRSLFILPQAKVVGKVEQRSDGGTGSEEHNLEGQLLGWGKGAVLNAVCALVV